MEIKNDKEIKKWYNVNHEQLKLKKKPMEKFMSDLDKNSRIFFAVYQDIQHPEIVELKVNEAKNTVEAPTEKSKRKKIFNILFFIFNLALVVLVFWNFANEQGGIQPLSTLFANHPNWSYLFIALGLYVATCIFNTLKFMFLVHNKTGKWKVWFCFKLATIGRYYDHITPLGSGGQPFEIYYLKKNGYSGDISTAIPLAKYMIWQIAFVILCFVILVFFPSTYASSTLVTVCAWVGIGLVSLLFLFVLFMSVTKKVGASIVVWVLKVGHKMRLIKDYRKTLEKVLRFVKQYQFCMKSFAKSPFTVLSVLIVSVASIISNAIIAYFVCISFVNVQGITWWDIVCKCCICELAVCFVPLPGGSGATELSFNALLGSIFTNGTLFWGILIWRILTYYLYIVQGAFILVWDIFAGRKKSKVRQVLENQPTDK